MPEPNAQVQNFIFYAKTSKRGMSTNLLMTLFEHMDDIIHTWVIPLGAWPQHQSRPKLRVYLQMMARNLPSFVLDTKYLIGPH